MCDADQLARLRVAVATGKLPPDLGRWLLGQFDATSRHPRGRRDDLLRQAAARIHGSDWSKAREIHELLLMFREYPGLAKSAWYHESNPAHWVQKAHRTDPWKPGSLRQVLRILD